MDLKHNIFLQTFEISCRNLRKGFQNSLICFKYKHTLVSLRKYKNDLFL